MFRRQHQNSALGQAAFGRLFSWKHPDDLPRNRLRHFLFGLGERLARVLFGGSHANVVVAVKPTGRLPDPVDVIVVKLAPFAPQMSVALAQSCSCDRLLIRDGLHTQKPAPEWPEG